MDVVMLFGISPMDVEQNSFQTHGRVAVCELLGFLSVSGGGREPVQIHFVTRISLFSQVSELLDLFLSQAGASV